MFDEVCIRTGWCLIGQLLLENAFQGSSCWRCGCSVLDEDAKTHGEIKAGLKVRLKLSLFVVTLAITFGIDGECARYC